MDQKEKEQRYEKIHKAIYWRHSDEVGLRKRLTVLLINRDNFKYKTDQEKVMRLLDLMNKITDGLDDFEEIIKKRGLNIFK